MGGRPSSSRVILCLSGRCRAVSGDWIGWLEGPHHLWFEFLKQIPFVNIAIISHQSSKSTFGGNKDTSWKCRGKFFVRLMSGGGNPQSLIVADDVDNKQ